VPSTTSTPPTTEEVRPSTTVARPEPEWRRATGNLQGMPSECGNLSHVWSRPDTDEVIAGVALHGLWVNDTPRRDHWTQIGTGEGSDVIAHRPTSLVFDPEHPDTYWETGNYHEAGVYRTDDGGATFHHLGDAYHIDALSVDFTDPERRTLLAAVHESASVLRSTDGGETWEDVSASLPADTGFSIGPLVIDSSTFVLGTKQGPNAGVFRTTDGGTTWTKVNDEGVITPPLVATDGKIYFIPEGGALIASGDGGQTWDRVTSSTQLPASTWPVLMEMPDGRFASTRGDSIILSADGGGNWERVASLPYEPTGLAYAPDRKMFYIWKFDCSFTTDNDVPADAIMKLPFDYEKE
jgi:photosystem II stability/assembly factor-like uncharacterized protein